MVESDNISAKRKTQNALEELGLLEFAIKLAQITGPYEAVEIEELGKNNEWQFREGYRVIATKVRVVRKRNATLLNKAPIVVVESEIGEHWVKEDQIQGIWLSLNICKPVLTPLKFFRIVPSTGY
ncbi:hypothetical protein NTH44_003185 [Vibrio metoecus]